MDSRDLSVEPASEEGAAGNDGEGRVVHSKLSGHFLDV